MSNNLSEARVFHHISQADQAAALLMDDELIAWLNPAGADRVAHDGLVGISLKDSTIRLETHLATLAGNKSQIVSEFVRTFMKRVEERRPAQQLPLPIE